ncbi:hypothetical protein QZH41_016250 [Actinostola sp. cb2023]|nr:hypothetical protein QZH41_016250 [Actinostola sp. cb2023]
MGSAARSLITEIQKSDDYLLLTQVCGIGLMAVGIYVQLKVGDLAELQSVKYLTGSILIIAVGAVIALVSFFGCCGAVKENRCFLSLFFVILLFILCAEIAGTAMGYVYRDQVEMKLRQDLNTSLLDYGEKGHDGTTKAYNTLQQQEKCCGVNSYIDWRRTHYSNGNHSIVPDSCCMKMTKGCGKPFTNGTIYTDVSIHKYYTYKYFTIIILINYAQKNNLMVLKIWILPHPTPC